jgi:RNA polymerase sigma factor (sigma-70 family)
VAAVRFAVVSPADVTRFRSGDPDAVRVVYREFGRLVFAVAYRALGSRELAEDVTQQTFVKAWRSAASFDPSRALGPWLATIARRTAIDVHRQEARRRTETLGESTTETEPSVVSLPPGVERAYDVWAVREAIATLPPEEQDVVRLQHAEELSHAEIAERLAVPVGTVKSRSFRAHRRLAARLGHLRDVTG